MNKQLELDKKELKELLRRVRMLRKRIEISMGEKLCK